VHQSISEVELLSKHGWNKELLLATISPMVDISLITIDSSSLYTLNPSFTSKETHVRLNRQSSQEIKKQVEASVKFLDEDRKMLVQVKAKPVPPLISY
jgi:hypothetical protein